MRGWGTFGRFHGAASMPCKIASAATASTAAWAAAMPCWATIAAPRVTLDPSGVRMRRAERGHERHTKHHKRSSKSRKRERGVRGGVSRERGDDGDGDSSGRVRRRSTESSDAGGGAHGADNGVDSDGGSGPAARSRRRRKRDDEERRRRRKRKRKEKAKHKKKRSRATRAPASSVSSSSSEASARSGAPRRAGSERENAGRVRAPALRDASRATSANSTVLRLSLQFFMAVRGNLVGLVAEIANAMPALLAARGSSGLTALQCVRAAAA